MILRRLSQSLKEQNWTAIWIEFILLVSGVFLAIQVANWNESRKESAQEAAYLKNLAEDIRSDINEIDETIAVSRWRMSVLEALIVKSTGKPMPATYSLPIGVVPVQQAPAYTDAGNKSVGLAYVYVRTIDGNRSTYETIINTGGIGLIQDAKLLEQIQVYYADVDEIKDFERNLQTDCDNAVQALHAAGASPMDTNDLGELSAIFANNSKLMATSKTAWGSTGYQIGILLDLRQHAEKLANEIDKRIKP